MVEKSAEEILDLYKKDIGNLLRSKREQLGLSQHELASQAGVSQSSISKWERGQFNMSLYTLVHISTVLDLQLQNPFVAES